MLSFNLVLFWQTSHISSLEKQRTIHIFIIKMENYKRQGGKKKKNKKKKKKKKKKEEEEEEALS